MTVAEATESCQQATDRIKIFSFTAGLNSCTVRRSRSGEANLERRQAPGAEF
jgi:hypothetical protein